MRATEHDADAILQEMVGDLGGRGVSLRLPRHLTVDLLYIDSSVIHGLGLNPEDEAVPSGFIRLAGAFGVVAEGFGLIRACSGCCSGDWLGAG